MVFIVDYGKLCQKAISEFNLKELPSCLEKYSREYETVNDKLKWHSECDYKDDKLLKINFSVVHVYRKEMEVKLAFLKLYIEKKLDIIEEELKKL